MFLVEFVMDSGGYDFELPAVPREGDTVRLWGEVRKVTQVLWDPQHEHATESLPPNRPLVTVYLGERR